MQVCIRPKLKQVLQDATVLPNLPKDLFDDVATYAAQGTMPWTSLKNLMSALRSCGMHTPALQELCGFEDVLYHGHSITQPLPAKQPSPELVAWRQQLQARLDNLAYEGMVSDITAEEREAEEMKDLLPTTRAQLSYGAHVLIVMFTFFLLGYLGSKLYFGSGELWAGLFGCVGLTLGLFVEVLLLVIRTNKPTPFEERYPALFANPPGGKGGKTGTASERRPTGEEQGSSVRDKGSSILSGKGATVGGQGSIDKGYDASSERGGRVMVEEQLLKCEQGMGVEEGCVRADDRAGGVKKGSGRGSRQESSSNMNPADAVGAVGSATGWLLEKRSVEGVPRHRIENKSVRQPDTHACEPALSDKRA